MADPADQLDAAHSALSDHVFLCPICFLDPTFGLVRTCSRGADLAVAVDRVLVAMDAADDQCIFDDSTDCDCSRCAAKVTAWEREQGWHLVDLGGES